MQSVGPTLLIALLTAVAVLATICGMLASVVVRRNRRRARGFFVVGFLCGLTAGAVRRRRPGRRRQTLQRIRG